MGNFRAGCVLLLPHLLSGLSDGKFFGRAAATHHPLDKCHQTDNVKNRPTNARERQRSITNTAYAPTYGLGPPSASSFKPG